ncbi:hypothetical protein P3342_008231 [Pyrenophora teres f. teres]|nr:hypothetical protein P3342_008231 [Pyrenophora teres f. teres]
MSMPSSWGDLDLDEDEDGNGDYRRQLLDVSILERHPFTTQTFIPMGLSQQDKHTQYLVIVAPTLPASASSRHTGRAPPYPTPYLERKKSVLDVLPEPDPAPSPTKRCLQKASSRGCIHPQGPRDLAYQISRISALSLRLEVRL